jgi:hypothetical protein
MPYPWQYGLSILLSIVAGTITLIIPAGGALELAPKVIVILGIVNGVIAITQGFLPKVTKVPDPERNGLD